MKCITLTKHDACSMGNGQCSVPWPVGFHVPIVYNHFIFLLVPLGMSGGSFDFDSFAWWWLLFAMPRYVFEMLPGGLTGLVDDPGCSGRRRLCFHHYVLGSGALHRWCSHNRMCHRHIATNTRSADQLSYNHDSKPAAKAAGLFATFSLTPTSKWRTQRLRILLDYTQPGSRNEYVYYELIH